MKAYNIVVEGKVQGVFYRQSTREKAKELNVKGWVKNCDDGSVQIHAEGDPADLSEFIKWCHQGPRNARVSGVKHMEIQVNGYSGFEIIR